MANSLGPEETVPRLNTLDADNRFMCRQQFFDPIILPDRKALASLRDAALYITKLPTKPNAAKIRFKIFTPLMLFAHCLKIIQIARRFVFFIRLHANKLHIHLWRHGKVNVEICCP
jgi:hypothetical protein